MIIGHKINTFVTVIHIYFFDDLFYCFLVQIHLLYYAKREKNDFVTVTKVFFIFFACIRFAFYFDLMRKLAKTLLVPFMCSF